MLKTKHVKRSRLVCIIVFFLLTVPAKAQRPDPGLKLTLDYVSVTVESVLSDLTVKTGARFSYSPNRINSSRVISYSCTNKAFEDVLTDICEKVSLRYYVVNRYYILQPLDESVDMQVKKPAWYTISGTITDSSSNEAMIGATIYLKERAEGTISNNYGFFSLTLPAGSYTLQTSYLGYSPVTEKISLDADVNRNIQLRQIPFTLKEIVISSANVEKTVFSSPAAQTIIDPTVVQRQTSALGETDMLKSLDNLPGISFQSDGSSYFSVRGGSRDQNLILLDEAPVFNPSHLLGLFTPIIPEAIKHTAVYRADFPVQYGGRLSSVIDIRARDGNMNKFSGNASIGPVSTRFSLEGPFKKNSSSYFLSFRVSTFGLLVKAANPTVESFYFTDFTSKFNFRAGRRDRIFLTLFAGKDAFINKPGAVRNGLEWSNATGTLRWSHIYGSRLFSNTTLYASKYDYSLYTNYDKKLYWNSDITSTSIKSEFTWYISPRNSMRFGFNVSGYFFNPGNYMNAGSALDTLNVSKVNSSETVLYAGDEAELTSWLKLTYGIRFSSWSDFGEAFSIVYDDEYNPVAREEYARGIRYYSKQFVEPRLSLSLKTGKSSSVKLSYNRTIQHINQINNSISPLNTLEVWLPSGPNIKPQQADIFDAGFINLWSRHDMEFSADVYYKNMYNQPGFAGHAELLLNPYLEGEIRQGKGYAYGFEVLFRKKTGKLTGAISAGSTRSYLRIESLNNNRWFPSHYDRPVDLSITADYRLRPRWTINVTMIYTSGMTLSTPTGFYYYRGAQVPVYQELNNDRLPAYRRVDFGSTWQLNKTGKAFEHFFNLSFYNFFNTRNYAFLNFNKVAGSDNKYYVPADYLNPRDQIATYRYIYSIIPSFTYSLRF